MDEELMNNHLFGRKISLLVSLCVSASCCFAQSETTSETMSLDALSTGVPETVLPPLRSEQTQSVEVSSSPSDVSVTVTVDPNIADLEKDLTAYLSETGNVTTMTLADFENLMRERYTSEQTVNLKTVVLGTLKNSKDIILSGYNVRTALNSVIAEEGIYDLQTYASANASDSETPITAYRNTTTKEGRAVYRLLEEQYSLNAGMSQLLASGGTVDWSVDWEKDVTNDSNTVSPSWYSGTKVSISQPLLKGFGRDVTEYGIRMAGLEHCLSTQALRQSAIDAVGNAMMAYYDLVQANATVLVQRIALAQANELLRVNMAKYKADLLPQLDVLQAQAELSQREQDIVSGLKLTGDASDQLFFYFGDLLSSKNVALIPQDMPSLPAYELDEDKFMADARRYNPTYLQTLININKAQETERYAYDQMRPNLTANAGVRASGAGRDGIAPIDGVLDNKYTSWNAGLAWRFPLQNRNATANYASSLIGIQSAGTNRELTELNLLTNIREGIRQAQASFARTQFGKSTVEYNIQKVSDGVKRQTVGLATSYDVLQFEQDLANARISLIQALCLYNKSIIQLEMMKGTLFNRLCITPCGDLVLLNPNSLTKVPM